MGWLIYCTLPPFLLLLCSTVDARSPSPIDIRIDHYKAAIVHDLIINTPRPRFSWKLAFSKDTTQRNVQQTAYQVQLEPTRVPEDDSSWKWDSARVSSSQSIHVPYSGQHDLLPATNYRLRLRVWTTLSKEASEWTDWIRFRTSIFHLHEYLTTNVDLLWIGSTQINMNELRKEFLVPNTSPVRSATVYIAGIGYYELYINGFNVDPTRKLDPGWTTYEARTLLASFDLTTNITVKTLVQQYTFSS